MPFLSMFLIRLRSQHLGVIKAVLQDIYGKLERQNREIRVGAPVLGNKLQLQPGRSH